MTERDPPRLAGDPLPEAPLAMPVQVLEHPPRTGLGRALLALVTSRLAPGR